MSNVINGLVFEKMMQNALNNLFVHEKEINYMNVFPVADGDTGTNMRLTLENGLNNAKINKHLGKYLATLAKGMLLGARGNSGVILSQLFKGMSDELISKSIINPGEFKSSLIRGYKTAYKAVLNPVEGTILTVSRLGIENIKASIKGSISFIDTFKLYLDELNTTLKLTPSLLAVLKEANVLDSGAKGYIVIVEGMYKYLLGQIVERDLAPIIEDKANGNSELVNSFHIDLEVKVNDDFKIEVYSKKLKELSTSYDISLKDNIVHVIADSDSPTPIITETRKVGEIISIKLDNNKYVHEDKKEEPLPFKAIVFIACVSGSGIKNIYREFGVDIILEPNPSTQDFLDSFKRCNAERIVIYPNDKNVIETANQAAKLSGLNNITIIPTKNVIEGYYSLAMDVPDSTVSNRIDSISESVGVECINYSKAIKNYSSNDVTVSIGDYVAYLNDKVLVGSKHLLTAIKESLAHKEDIDSKSSAFILLGKNAPSDLEGKLNDLFSDKYSNIEVTIIDGEQEKEDLMIGLL